MIIRKPITKPVMRSVLTSLSTAASEAASALAVPPSLRSLLFHDDGTATEYPAYYTEEEWAEHSHLLKDYSLGVGDLREKRLGYCYDFDGVDDRIVTTFNPREILGSGPVSLACWVNLDDLGASTSQTSTFMGGFRGSSPDRRLYLRSESSGVVRLALGSGTVATTSVVLSANKWHHVVATFNGLNAKIYVDGTERTASGSGISADYFDYGLPIGDLFESSGTSYDGVGGENHETNGRISDVRIYNDALTADEVAYIYTNGQSGTDPGSDNLVAHYPLQEESGATAYDISGNGHHGRILNAVTSGVGSIHQPDAGVVKSYANDEGYSKATNLLPYSEKLDDTSWNNSSGFGGNLFVIANSGIAPNGTLTADEIYTTSSNAARKTQVWPIQPTGGQSYTISGYFKQVNPGSKVDLVLDIWGGSSNQDPIWGTDNRYPRVSYTFDADLLETNTIDGTVQRTLLQDGWVRISVTLVALTTPSTGTRQAALSMGGNASNRYFAWGLQLEERDHPGPYTVTTASPSVDVVVPSTSGKDASDNTFDSTYTGRCPNYGLAKGPAWQGDGSAVYVDLAQPILPTTTDGFKLEFWFRASTTPPATRVILSQNIDFGLSYGYVAMASNGLITTRLHGLSLSSSVAYSDGVWRKLTAEISGSTYTLTIGKDVFSTSGALIATANSNAALLARSNDAGLRIDAELGPVSITTGGLTTTYSPIEGTRNVAVTRSDGTYAVIADAVKNGALATLYSDGDGSWQLPEIANGAHFDGTGLYPAAPGASVAANGNALNIPANKHPIGLLVDRTGGVAAPFDYQSGTDGYTNEAFSDIPTEITLNKRGLSIYAADRYGAALEDIQS